MNEQMIVDTIMQKIKKSMRIDLDSTKKLMEKVEAHCKEKGLNAVICVCGPEGNVIGIHVMDDAFLVSFDVAMRKAYTSVAVKMPTIELAKIAQPGETFYGVDGVDHGRITIIGGGIPLTYKGRIIGGLGVSGGTSEQDHEAAEYGLSVLAEVMEA